jgi:hypothetical protein
MVIRNLDMDPDPGFGFHRKAWNRIRIQLTWIRNTGDHYVQLIYL